MNRNIKFRVWSEDENGFLKYIDGYSPNFLRVARATSFGSEWLDVKKDNLFIEQFTGIKDKNDKEIYEGDFVECHDKLGYSGKIYGIVKFDSEYGAFRIAFSDIFAWTFYQIQGEVEVIGNIRENPELL